MTSLARKTWRWVAGLAAGLVILLAVLVGAFRIALGQVPEYQDQLVAWLGEKTHLDIAVGSLDARWHLYGPALTFERVTVRSVDGTVTLATARRGSVSLDLVESIRTGRLIAGRFELVGPELALVRAGDGRMRLVGQESLTTPGSTDFDLDALPTGRLVVTDAELSFVDQTRADTPVRVFDAVSFELERRARRMSVNGRGTLPADLGQELAFQAESQGDLHDPRALTWRFQVESRALDIAGWRSLLPAAWPVPVAGTADVELRGSFAGARVNAFTGRVSLADVQVDVPAWSIPMPPPAPMEQPADYPLPPGRTTALAARPARPDPSRFEAYAPPPRVSYAIVSTEFAYERTEPGGTLRLEDLEWTGPFGRWRPSTVELDWRGQPGEDEITVSGRVSHVAPAAFWPLLGLAPQSIALAQVRALDLAGEFDDLEFEIERGGDARLTFSVAGRFTDLSSRASGKVPGLQGLSGSFQTSDFGGHLVLETSDLIVDLPRWYLEPLRAGRLSGAVTWRRLQDGWRVLSDALDLMSPSGRIRGSFELTLPGGDASPVLDAVATLSDIEARAVPTYLPVGRLRPRSVAWLSQALLSGRVPEGTLVYHGPMRGFPLAADEGQFELNARVVDASVLFQRGWPALQRAAGEVTFRNQGVSGQLTEGRIGELGVASGHFEVPILKRPVVSVSARGSGELATALNYLKASPLAAKLGETLPRLELGGAAQFVLDLKMPLRRPRESRFTLRTKVDGASATLANQPLVATELMGELTIIDGGVATEGLDGRLLGGPFHLVATAGEALPGERPTSTIVVEGSLTATDLVRAYPLPDAITIGGSTGWYLDGTIHGGPRGTAPPQHYVLTSDLVGLDLALPAPLTKPQERVEALRAEFEYDGAGVGMLRLSTREGRAIGRLERSDSRDWRIERGAVRYDGRGVALPDHEGLRIEGGIDRLDLGGWLALRREGQAPRSRLRDLLTAATVRVAHLDLWGYEFADVRAILQQQDAGWQIDVAGTAAEGRVIVPYQIDAGVSLVADLDRLIVPPRAERARSQRTADPRRMPGMQIRVGDLTYANYHLGSVRAQVLREREGIRIESAIAQGGSYHAELSGAWLAPASGEATSVDFTLASTSVERTLDEFGYTNAVTGSRGFLRGNLAWPGPPRRDALEHASGSLRIEAEDGQVLNVEPGAGRVLGLMSLAALPRRLALDFSDLTDKGLAFDSITGDFELRNGTAFTDNLLLRGPAAEVGIAGRTDLGAREYDQTAVVTGNLGASLGVAGALAGGPAVGAALLLFSQIFKEPLKGITRGYYRISGSWEEPVIERILTGEVRNEARAAQLPQAREIEADVPD